MYSAGGETSRSEHCRGSYGERIVIVSESFDPSWTSGARGRLTVAGRAALDRAAAELRDA